MSISTQNAELNVLKNYHPILGRFVKGKIAIIIRTFYCISSSMSGKAIPGICPNCSKEALVIEEQIRDPTDWQIKYDIECQFCGYRFKVDKKTFDDLLTLSTNKKQA